MEVSDRGGRFVGAPRSKKGGPTRFADRVLRTLLALCICAGFEVACWRSGTVRMLKWISATIEDARIAWSFLGYQKAKRAEHLADADHRFSSEKLEREIAKLFRGPTQEAAIRFGQPAASLNAEITTNRERIREFSRKIEVLQRNYTKELSDLYEKVADAKTSLSDLYEEKSEAHEEIRDAKESIDHWYRMSNCYLGNKGREIPKSRIFGRSQNDLEGFKSDKSDAINKLKRCQNAIAELHADKASYSEEINKVKNAQLVMRSIMNRGVTVPSLNKAVADASSSISELTARINDIEIKCASFLHESKINLGIPEREAEVIRIKKRHQDYIKAFDSVDAVAQRKAQHKREWRTRNSTRQ